MHYHNTGPSMGFTLSKPEKMWLRQAQPRLFYNEKAGKMAGYFDFRSTYHHVPITDSYEIWIDLVHLDFPCIPQVFEVGNRIRTTASLYNLPLVDMHQYKDNKLCLIHPGAFIKDFSSQPFTVQLFFKIINSVLYWHTYFEWYGKEPWPAEEHGWNLM